MSISKLAKIADTEEKLSKIIVLVGNVLDDERMIVVPKMRVCALKFSEDARRRILKAGGEVFTFDQLAKMEPEGTNTLLLRGKRSRESIKHFRGVMGDKAKPFILNNNHRARERKFGHATK